MLCVYDCQLTFLCLCWSRYSNQKKKKIKQVGESLGMEHANASKELIEGHEEVIQFKIYVDEG